MKMIILSAMLLLVFASLVNAEIWTEDHSYWTVTSATGEEAQLDFWSANAKDKKTELGWLAPDNDCSGWGDKYLYDLEGNQILDNKDKAIKLKCESSKCDGLNCYHISLTEAQAVNIDDYIKLGVFLILYKK